jgi:hypothetical protein
MTREEAIEFVEDMREPLRVVPGTMPKTRKSRDMDALLDYLNRPHLELPFPIGSEVYYIDRMEGRTQTRMGIIEMPKIVVTVNLPRGIRDFNLEWNTALYASYEEAEAALREAGE